MMSGLFRSWKPPPKGKDPEIQRLEKEAEETRQKIAALREQGRQRRANRLQSLDALETRRMTLVEILKRMDKELAEKDVDDYADVLAEAFGERKIYAHRAIGLEALLCQFMHQMLAKQHQLKIMKRSGKELHKLYQTSKNQNREEFHSYEALAVHLETMRLSLVAQYDDIFAAQHSLLARFHHVEAHGTITNYKIVKPPPPQRTEKAKQPKLSVSKKHTGSPKNSATTTNDTGESDDEDAMMHDILTGKDGEDSWAPPSRPLQEINLDASKSSRSDDSPELRSSSRKSSSNEGGNMKSARNRRREIEQKRLASGRGKGSSSNVFEDADKDKAREKMRELEAKRASLNNDSELQERSSPRSSHRNTGSLSDHKKESRSPTSRKESGTDDRSLSPSGDEEIHLTSSDMRREKRKSERAAARISTTSSF
jgi:hypothetical protein